MRLYFELTPNTEPVPWDYQHFLIGRLHGWLGRNKPSFRTEERRQTL
jgi:CRISPR-associated endoribonuclease Cas6